MTDNSDCKKTVAAIGELLRQSGLAGAELKAALRDVVSAHWPDMPPWSTLETPKIEDVQKASLGSGVALIFHEGGVTKAVLAQAGSHYAQADTAYMIPGGFVNLSVTEGSAHVPASNMPEDAATGAAREIEEELKKPDGTPLLPADPARLKPMDTKTLVTRDGGRSVVIGFMMELSESEVAVVRQHADSIACDAVYADAAMRQSINHDSGKPEISGVSIVDLNDVVAGKYNLLHKDQLSLFKAVAAHVSAHPPARLKSVASPRPPRKG